MPATWLAIWHSRTVLLGFHFVLALCIQIYPGAVQRQRKIIVPSLQMKKLRQRSQGLFGPSWDTDPRIEQPAPWRAHCWNKVSPGIARWIAQVWGDKVRHKLFNLDDYLVLSASSTLHLKNKLIVPLCFFPLPDAVKCITAHTREHRA